MKRTGAAELGVDFGVAPDFFAGTFGVAPEFFDGTFLPRLSPL